MRTVAALLLVFVAPLWADPSISVPAEVKGETAAFVQVPATTKGKSVKWVALDPGLNLFPVELLKDTKTAVVSASVPGRYRVLAYTAVNGEPSEAVVCVVVIGGKPPVPPDPPGPVDPLVAELRRLYDADPAPAELKRQVATQLAALYRQAIPLAGDRGLLTVGMYSDSLKGKAGNVPQGLTEVRKRVAVELVALFGAEPAMEFNDAKRTQAAALFARLAAAMEVVQ